MGLGDKIFGKKVTPKQIPFEKLKQLDVGEASKKGLAFQKETLADATSLASTVNISAQEEKRGLLESALPGFSGFQSQLGELFSTTARDPFEIPEPVFDLLKQKAGERGVTGGFAGSEFQEFDLLRNLGTKALELGNQRIANATNLFNTLVATAPTISPVSPLSFLPTTGEFIGEAETNLGVDRFNIINKQKTDQLAENARASAESRTGILKGAISGAVTGFAAGGPWGALAGAVVGGTVTGFGGDATAAGELGGEAGLGIDKTLNPPKK